jgi:hypothetical protein
VQESTLREIISSERELTKTVVCAANWLGIAGIASSSDDLLTPNKEDEDIIESSARKFVFRT